MVVQDVEDNPRDRVVSLLKDLFQFDLADLDFGIYRIMNFKRKEIERFIEKDLVGKVEQELSSLARQSADQQRKAMEDLAAEANRTLGEGTIDKEGEVHQFKDAKIVQQYLATRKELAKAEGDRTDAVTIYNHLYEFFSRYYDQGDFLSKRRVGGREKYVVPYSGEEVFLHWANRDQYYAKTGEYFSNYDFKVGKWGVRFVLVKAEVSQDNIKGNNRYFILSTDRSPEVDSKEHELRVFFNYRGLTEPEVKSFGKKVTQDGLSASAASVIWNAVGGSELASLLNAKKAGDERSLLEVHLNRYVKKNTTDYFIHKDLGGFLRRELDYFIQAEVLRPRELTGGDLATIQKTVNRTRTFQAIADTIIDFLAQIEDFQKLLFEKKKLVLRTDYLVPIRKVPRSLWPQVLSCKKQVAEWVDLYSLEPKKDLLNPKGEMNEHLLDKYPNLVVDTQHFDPTFKGTLLESFDDVDDACGGILVRAENFQALRLLDSRFSDRVNTVYIDPPFNTAATEILYKNDYKHSSWLSMISERIRLSTRLMTNESILCVAIDDAEFPSLIHYLSSSFGEEAHLATVVVRSNPHGRAMAEGFSTNHEYALFFANGDEAVVGRLPRGERGHARYPEKDNIGSFTWINFRGTGAHTNRVDRPKLFYPVYASKKGVRVPQLQWNENGRRWEILERPTREEVEVLPIDDDKSERVWSLGPERAREEASTDLESRETSKGWQIYRKYRPNQEGALPATWWEDAKYSATESGTRVLKDLFGGRESFTYPKSVYLVKDCLRAASSRPSSWVLDFFAGSGTTAHAVIELNREDGGNRKFILVEVSDYFDTVIVPRVKKVIFAPEWKEGKPTGNIPQSNARQSPDLIKVFRLESYEDTLNNIVFKERDKTVQETLDSLEGYFIRYMLDYETRGSKTRFSVKDFEDPFAYKIRSDGREDAEIMPVDLVETFNLLLGLSVEKIRFARSGKRPYSCVIGRAPDGGRTVIVWRPTKDIDYVADRDFIQDSFLKELKGAFSLYANGLCHVKGAKSIEPVFKELMGA